MATKDTNADASASSEAQTEEQAQQQTDNQATDQVENSANSAAEPDNAAAEGPAPGIESPTEEDQLRKQLQEANDKYLRLYSDFENFRKRTQKERLDLLQNAATDTVTKLLPVLDDFDRAVANNQDSEDLNGIKEGMQLVHHKFHHTLEQMGLKPIDAMEQVFDIDHHEAVTTIPAPDKNLKGKVVDVIEKGYFLHDKVVRYAKVVVGE